MLKLEHFGKSTEIPGNFPNVVPEKDGEGNWIDRVRSEDVLQGMLEPSDILHK